MNEKTGLNTQPHPRLKMAAKEINDVFSKYDVGGFSVMFLDMQIETIVKIDPSFSLISLNEVRAMKINKPIEDPQNPEPAKQKVNDTINMLYHLVRGGMAVLQNFKRAEMTVRGVFGMAENQNGKMK